MEENTYPRSDGMIIAGELDPKEVAAYLADRGVVAEMEWYPQTPNMVGIRVANDEGNVATLKSMDEGIVPGPTLISLVEDLAARFSAEVMIGDSGVDRLPEDSDPAVALKDQPEGPMRVVEISATPASAVPLVAAFEGLDVADIDLPEGKRALAAELPAMRSDWFFAEAPLVALTYHDGEFQAFLVEDDDPENVVTYNWAMDQALVAGAAGDDAAAVELAQELVGSRDDVLRIHDGVPGVDGTMAWKSTSSSGADAVREFVQSLGLPKSIAGFLLGETALEDIDDARVHEARGVSNAIARSVGIMIDEKEETSEAWGRYSERLSNHPWQVPMTSGVQAVVGAILVALSRRRDGKRSWPMRIGAITGSMLLVDAVAELALSRYVSARNARRQRREDLQF